MEQTGGLLPSGRRCLAVGRIRAANSRGDREAVASRMALGPARCSASAATLPGGRIRVANSRDGREALAFGVYRNRRSPYGALATALVAGWLLGGCSSGASITVDVDVPRPLVEPIDAAVGIYFNDELRNYVHEEELVDHGRYRIDIGASHAPVFAQVFDAMFEAVVPVALVGGDEPPADEPPADEPPADEPAADEAPADEAGAEDADLEEADAATDSDAADAPPVRFTRADGSKPAVAGIIAPSIEEVQFAIPKQTGGEFYEVWIRYRLDLYDTNGNRLGEYPVIGYGKANEANFGGFGQASPALNEATMWALRDAAALLSFQFRDQPESRDWLAMIANRQAYATPTHRVGR